MGSPSSAVSSPGLRRPDAAQAPKLFPSTGRRNLLFCLLLAAFVLLAYRPVTRNGFLDYDDDHYITNNVHVQAGLTRDTVKWAFTTFDEANWHPLTWLSHALDCQLFGLSPAGHHLTNVLLQVLNAILLFLLLQSATGFQWRSLMVAALFALHPINVESVAWAAERKNVLSMTFFLLALYAYAWYARRPEIRRYAVVTLCFALSLLSKPQAITLPFLLCLWDYWPLRRIGPSATPGDNVPRVGVGRLVLEKIPLLFLSIASAVITMKAQRTGGAVQTLSLYSPLLRLETAVVSYVSYLGKWVWPSKLVALYPHPVVLYPVWQVAAASVLLLVVSVWSLRARNRRYLAIGWFWFLGSLVPMIGLVQVGSQAMADRYSYIPFIGLFLMWVWLVADCAQANHVPARWLAVPAVCWLLVLGTLTNRQVAYWHDTPSFWRRTLALTENNYIAHDSLGQYLASEGRSDEAAAQFRAALAIRPDDLPANLNLGTYAHAHGDLPTAIARYQIVAQYAGDVGLRATAYANLGSAYRQMAEFVKAKECFETSLRLSPAQPLPMIGLGLIAQKAGDFSEAVRQYSEAMAVQPTDVGYLLMAQALQQAGRTEDANAIFDRVKRLSPDLPAAQKMARALLDGK